MAGVSDPGWVARLSVGEPGAWREAEEWLAPRLIRYFEKTGLDHHCAEDLAQDALVAVYRKVGELREPGRFDAWVGMIAKNLMRSSLRRSRPTEALDDEAPVAAPETPAPIDDEELRGVVREELGRVRPAARKLLDLRILQGMSSAEASTALGISRDTQRKRLHAALKDLRGRLARRLFRSAPG